MRSFTFETIKPSELDAFSACHPQGNFQQTSHMGAHRANSGIDVSYLGVREAGELVAATALEIHRSRLSTFATIHDGPLVDFSDTELAAYFLEQLKQAARSAGAAQLEISPEVPYLVRDSAGNPLPSADAHADWPANVPASAPSSPNTEALETIQKAGFAHEGFTTGYSAVPRWRYVKDLAGIEGEQALLATYAKNTRRNVRIAHESSVVVERVSRDELGTFHDICELSCEKQGFDNRSLSFFESLFDAFGDVAEFNIAYIDTASYLASWEAKRDGFAADIARFERLLETSPSPEKVEKKLRDARSKHEASLKRVEDAQGYRALGERIPAAAALFIWHERECVYLFSGSDPAYAKFYAATAIQHQVMCECLERGVTRYNFYGINGIFDDPNDPGRGLLEFKQGFNGYVEELMGEFMLPVKPVTYAIKQLAHKVLQRR